MASPVDWKKMKVPELKEELARRGMDTSGLKAALLQRLEEAQKSDSDPPASTNSNGTALSPVKKPVSEKDAEVKLVTKEVKIPGVQTAMEQTENGVTDEKKADGVDKPDAEAGTEDDKRKKRAERFGTTLPDDLKKVMRAERFGLKMDDASNPASKGTVEGDQAAKLKARAERFGLPVSQNGGLNGAAKVELDEAELEKRRKRAERYNIPLNSVEPTGVAKSSTASAEDDSKKAARAARFGAPVNGQKAGSAEQRALSPEQKAGSLGSDADLEKKRRRAEKFGVPLATGVELEAKKKHRAERFQQVAA